MCSRYYRKCCWNRYILPFIQPCRRRSLYNIQVSTSIISSPDCVFLSLLAGVFLIIISQQVKAIFPCGSSTAQEWNTSTLLGMWVPRCRSHSYSWKSPLISGTTWKRIILAKSLSMCSTIQTIAAPSRTLAPDGVQKPYGHEYAPLPPGCGAPYFHVVILPSSAAHSLSAMDSVLPTAPTIIIVDKRLFNLSKFSRQDPVQRSLLANLLRGPRFAWDPIFRFGQENFLF